MVIPQPDKPGPKKSGLAGNYKLQNTNYKQTTIPKLQIPKKVVPFGPAARGADKRNSNACGETLLTRNTMADRLCQLSVTVRVSPWQKN